MPVYLILDPDGYGCGYTVSTGALPASPSLLEVPDETTAMQRLGHREEEGVWVPRPAAPPVPRTLLTKAEFYDRFTDDELGDLKQLAGTNKTAAGYLEWLQVQMAVDLENARLIAGLDRLVTAGKITAARRDELLVPA